MSTKPIVAASPARSNSEKTVNNSLTEKPTAASIENVPGNDTGHNSKQFNGGKVRDTQPPTMCGIFLSAAQPGDSTSLPGVRGISRASGNTRGAIVDALRDTGQPLAAKTLNNSTRKTQ